MKEFILLFRHENARDQVSPGQMALWMEQQRAWVAGIQAQDKWVSGTGLLFEDARVVHFGGKVSQGPFGTGKETLGGFVRIRAESVEEAVAFAHGAPVLQADGNTVEVREAM